MIEDQGPPMLKPTLMAGLSAGILTSVPLLGGFLLLACCSPVIGAGFLAAFWYNKACREAGVEFTPGLGKTVGLISGAFWAVTVTVFAVLSWPGIDRAAEDVEKTWDALGQTTPELLDALDGLVVFYQETSGFMLVLLVFFVYLLIGAVFATLGGMIGAVLFRNRQPSA